VEPLRDMPPSQRIISQAITSPAVFRISPEGRLTNLNQAMARLFGHGSPAQMLTAVTDVGTQLFMSPEVWPEYRRRVLNEGFVVDFEFEARRADGSSMWLSQDACAVRDDKGTISRFECFAKDITELKRTCLALDQRLREVLNARSSAANEPQRDGAFKLTLLTLPRGAGEPPSPADLHVAP
jgi:PAS domain S-box-containing protein